MEHWYQWTPVHEIWMWACLNPCALHKSKSMSSNMILFRLLFFFPFFFVHPLEGLNFVPAKEQELWRPSSIKKKHRQQHLTPAGCSFFPLVQEQPSQLLALEWENWEPISFLQSFFFFSLNIWKELSKSNYYYYFSTASNVLILILPSVWGLKRVRIKARMCGRAEKARFLGSKMPRLRY